jgi:hypothetical protein
MLDTGVGSQGPIGLKIVECMCCLFGKVGTSTILSTMLFSSSWYLKYPICTLKTKNVMTELQTTILEHSRLKARGWTVKSDPTTSTIKVRSARELSHLSATCITRAINDTSRRKREDKQPSICASLPPAREPPWSSNFEASLLLRVLSRRIMTRITLQRVVNCMFCITT